MPLNFKSVFEHSPAPTMILDEDLVFVAANPAYQQMVGVPLDGLLGNCVFDVFPESEARVDNLKSVFEKTLAGQATTLTEMPFRLKKNGIEQEHWWTIHHAPVVIGDDGQKYLIQFCENVTEQVKMREMRNALLGEMQHRVGNIFTIVAAIARQTARVSDTVPAFLQNFNERLNAFLRVNRQMTGDGAGKATMRAVVEDQLKVHANESAGRINIEGPECPLSIVQSQAIGMAVHELATNSIKYGALGPAEGELSITWDVLPGNGCLFRWLETGLGEVRDSDKSGYGTMLLNTIIPSQLDGSAARDFKDGSMLYSLEIGGTA